MRIARAALVAALWGGTALAGPVEVTVRPVADFAGQPFQWEAYALDLPESAGEVPIATSGGPLTGDWLVELERGTWQISGFGEGGVLTGTIVVADPGAVFEIAAETPIPPPPYRCPDTAAGCDLADPATLIAFRLPMGWAADQPVLIAGQEGGTGEGEGPLVRMIFFEEVDGEGGDAWFLNPADWGGQLGPCRETGLGSLCTFSETPRAVAAFDIIAPSLRRVTAEEAAAP